MDAIPSCTSWVLPAATLSRKDRRQRMAARQNGTRSDAAFEMLIGKAIDLGDRLLAVKAIEDLVGFVTEAAQSGRFLFSASDLFRPGHPFQVWR